MSNEKQSCVPPCFREGFRKTVQTTLTSIGVPAQASSSSKNSCPALRNRKMHLHFLFPQVALRILLVTKSAAFSISRSDCECFSSEDGCSAAAGDFEVLTD
jgi:hypothetical protein